MNRGKNRDSGQVAVEARVRLFSRKEFIEALGFSLGMAAAGKSSLGEAEAGGPAEKAPVLAAKPPARKL